MSKSQNRYESIIELIFTRRHQPGDANVAFARTDIEEAARELGITLPRNIGDVLYSFRFRVPLPESVASTAPAGNQWVIELAGRGEYRFSLRSSAQAEIAPNPLLSETKIPDATPGIVIRYALNDEQALLAKVRYNRLIDIFTGVTCYSLQNHLRTTAPSFGQIETDEIYIGVDKHGNHYLIPVQAKGGRDRLSIVQIEQDMAMAREKFPALLCRPIGAQFMNEGVIALFEFTDTEQGIRISSERHYRLVAPDAISEDDLRRYRLSLAE